MEKKKMVYCTECNRNVKTSFVFKKYGMCKSCMIEDLQRTNAVLDAAQDQLVDVIMTLSARNDEIESECIALTNHTTETVAELEDTIDGISESHEAQVK